MNDTLEVTIAPPSLGDPTAAQTVSPAERERAQAALCIVDGNHLLSKMAELLLGNREVDGVSKRGGIASGLRRLAARLEHIGQEGGFDHRELPPAEIAKLERLPDRMPSRSENIETLNFAVGWNACIDAIRKHREPPKAKTL